jgi:hypothetical protein
VLSAGPGAGDHRLISAGDIDLIVIYGDRMNAIHHSDAGSQYTQRNSAETLML